MYIITETGSEPYVARNEDEVVDYALEYAREYGNYSGMEEWEEDVMRHWIRRELEQAESRADDLFLDLYISGPVGHGFVVRAG